MEIKLMKRSIAFYLMILFFAILFAYAFGMKVYKENVNNHALEVQEELEDLWKDTGLEIRLYGINEKYEEILDEKHNKEGRPLYNGKRDKKAEAIVWNWFVEEGEGGEDFIKYSKPEDTVAAFADIDDDGVDELFGSVYNSYMCGANDTGCFIYVFKKTENGYEPWTIMGGSFYTAIILKSKTGKYHHVKTYITNRDDRKLKRKESSVLRNLYFADRGYTSRRIFEQGEN